MSREAAGTESRAVQKKGEREHRELNQQTQGHMDPAMRWNITWHTIQSLVVGDLTLCDTLLEGATE